MSIAKYMSGRVIVKEEPCLVRRAKSGGTEAVFKRKSWVFFTKEDIKVVPELNDMIEKVSGGKSSFDLYIDNKTGVVLTLKQVFEGVGAEASMVERQRQAQDLAKARIASEKAFEDNKMTDTLKLSIVLLFILGLITAIAIFYLAQAMHALATSPALQTVATARAAAVASQNAIP